MKLKKILESKNKKKSKWVAHLSIDQNGTDEDVIIIATSRQEALNQAYILCVELYEQYDDGMDEEDEEDVEDHLDYDVEPYDKELHSHLE